MTVAGMKVGSSITRLAGTVLADRASAIDALYVHDDRTGPYLRADIVKKSPRKLHLDIGYGFGVKRKSEDWALTHILIPMHGKIRLSFDELRLLATKYIAGTIEAIRIYATGRQIKETTLAFETLILRSSAYLEHLIFGDTQLSAKNLNQIRTMLSLSRYVGVIRFDASYFGSIQVLVDTTSTPRNINCLAIIATEVKSDYTKFLVRTLAEIYDCPYVT